MEKIHEALAPLTDWMPPEVRGLLDIEVWWLVELVVVLAVLLVLGLTFKRVGRALFGRRRRPRDWDKGLRQDLESAPMPVTAPGEYVLCVYHVPVRLRLVVVAPAGTSGKVDPAAVPGLLDRVVPGLAKVLANDRPDVRVWPPQLSYQGFVNSFHRCTPTPEREGEPSPWILLAGKAQPGGPALLVGLALWAQAPQTLGRLNLEPHQWLDVLRLRHRREVIT